MTYQIGDYVSVSGENVNGQPNTEGGCSFIIELSLIDTTVCTPYSVGNIVERNISISRVRSSNINSITQFYDVQN